MKKSFLSLSFVFFFSAVMLSPILQAQNVHGNGKVVRETREIGSFSQMNIGGVFKIFLSQGSDEAVIVEADDNLLDYIRTEVVGNKLKVRIDDGVNIKRSERMNIYITFKEVNEIDIHGVNTVNSEETLSFNDLRIERAGVGNTELSLACNNLYIESNAVGTIKLEGRADEMQMRNTGVGSVKANDFIVQKMKLENSGIGSVSVHADKTIEINSSGIGSVTYSGNASVTKLNSSGLGKIKKR